MIGRNREEIVSTNQESAKTLQIYRGVADMIYMILALVIIITSLYWLLRETNNLTINLAYDLKQKPEHKKPMPVIAPEKGNLIYCQFCSWRIAERFECAYKERRIIKDTDLPTPLWCPLRENPDGHETAKIKTH